jgi:molybdenum cofactor biosynthesis enzyme
MTREAARRLYSTGLHSGHALVLARATGIRAARRAAELMDLHAHVITGPVELDFRADTDARPASVLCQSHVSSVDGNFFPAGSLMAAVAAAATLADLVREEDPAAIIQAGRIVEESWLVGSDDEEATIGM